MNRWSGLLLLLSLNVATADTIIPDKTATYLKQLQRQNHIDYNSIINSRGAYIPAVCYANRQSIFTEKKTNPCQICHTRGRIPNYINDSNLVDNPQFPMGMVQNPYRNLLRPQVQRTKLSETELMAWIRQSNYIHHRKILLQQQLPSDWPGYRPDSYFNFDKKQFDRNINEQYSGWFHYEYYPFPGAFLPSNGSMGDSQIRLPSYFRQDKKGQFNIEVYRINLAIVESLIKFKTIKMIRNFDEKKLGIDLNKNGKLDGSNTILFPPVSYVGKARQLLQNKKIHLAPGLFPVGTEFLHSVRYIDWDNKKSLPIISARMKELRYSRKYRWYNYAELRQMADNEFVETQQLATEKPVLDLFRGNASHGLRTPNGWLYQGFIEARDGSLRPQTKEETIFCMGCHSGIGATTDSNFSFVRKKEQNNKKIIQGYINYLKDNPTGDDFQKNTEIKNRFFDQNSQPIREKFSALFNNLNTLLYPSQSRAIKLNLNYLKLVKNQSFIYGRELPMHKNISIFKSVIDGNCQH